MSHSIIKNNISRLLKEKDWKIADLDHKVGANRSVSNILRGSSKNPTIELLQSIAKALNVEVQDLLEEHVTAKGTNTPLLLDSCKKVLSQIEALALSENLNYRSVITMVREVYEYSVHLGLQQAEDNFVKWTVHKHTNT